MKYTIVCGLIMAFIVCMSTAVYAVNEEVKVLVNGRTVQSNVPPVNVDGSIMLPFRPILNSIGVQDSEIVWREKSKSIEIRHNNKYVFLVIGSRGAVVNQSMIMLNVAPFINEGYTMIPVRFVSEVFDADVQWNNDTKTVNIKTKK